MRKSKITKGEKRLTGVLAISVALLVGIGLWQYNLNAEPVIHIPSPHLPSPNAYDFYAKAAKTHDALLRATPGIAAIDKVTDTRNTSGLSGRQLAKFYPSAAKEAWVRKNAPALRVLRQGFAYSFFWPMARSSSISFPNLNKFYELSYLLRIECHARQECGDWSGASRSTLDLMRFGQDISRGGPLFVSGVGPQLMTIGRRELQSILPHLSAPAARAAIAQIEKLQATRVSYAEMLQEEEWTTQAWLQFLMRQPNWVAGLDWSKSNSTVATLHPRLTSVINAVIDEHTIDDIQLHLRMQTVSKRTVMENYTHYVDALIAQAKRPYTMRQTPLPGDIVTETLIFDAGRAACRTTENDVGDTLLQVQLALHAFKIERGAFPHTLNELVPSYLKTLPRDAFGSGEAICYRQAGKNYLLYSIGPDGKDDGGKAIYNPNPLGLAPSHAVQFDSKGDVVAGVNP